MSDTGPGEVPIGELLSARLDGELSAVEERRVAAALAEAPDLADETEALDRVRSALRAQGPVEPPTGFIDGLVAGAADGDRRQHPDGSADVVPLAGRRRRRLAAALAATAAAAVLVVVAVVGFGTSDGMVPPVEEFAARHDAVMASAPAPDGFVVMSDEELDAMEGPMAAPATLASRFERLAGFHDDAGTMHVVYGSGNDMISVYAQSGTVDFDDLPDGGDQMEMDGDDAWIAAEVPVDGRTVEVLVIQRGDMAYTFVADAPHAEVVAVADGLRSAAA